MRRLGAALGVEAMSLYNHVPNKAALLDGMVELILEEMPTPGPGGARTERLTEMAWAFRSALQAHPGAAPLFATRPAVTLTSLKHVESALGLLRGLGLSPDASLGALQVLVTFVVGHTLSRLGPARADEVSRPRYEDLSREEFPHLTEIAALLPAHDGENEFDLGLNAFLTGLRAGVRRAAPKRE